MRIAFLNLCHCDPAMVRRTAARLTAHEDFGMFVHVDAKADIEPFREALDTLPRVRFTKERQRVYWGGFNAVAATVSMLEQALASPREYSYFVLLQNLDYPVRSNEAIEDFFVSQNGTEFIRACNIANIRDPHFFQKYRVYNQRDDDFYLAAHSRTRMYLRYAHMALRSVGTMLFDGVIREDGEAYPIHYGAAQWAVTRRCAEYVVRFYHAHPGFNGVMRHVQFPDEEYFHTIVHNSPLKAHCIRHDESAARWLVNWRNLHYFEYPREITVFREEDFARVMAQDALFIRKVRTGVSDGLLDKIDTTLVDLESI